MKRALFIIIILAALVMTIPRTRRLVRIVLLTAVANPHCSWSDGLRGYVTYLHRSTRVEELQPACRIKQTDAAGYQLWTTPIGDFWAPKDAPIAGMLTEVEQGVYPKVRPGDVALDCGANVGVVTRAFLNAGARLVVAVEPLPENVECLRRNFAPEVQAGRVIVCPKGVWDKQDFLTMSVADATGPSFVLDRGANTAYKLPLTTIDSLVAEYQLDRVDYIKMDIEGAERRALAGARETLKRFRPALAISAYHLPDDPERIAAAVRAARPDYRRSCTTCLERDGNIIPELFHFY